MIFEECLFDKTVIRQQGISHAMLSGNKHRPMMRENLHTRHVYKFCTGMTEFKEIM